MKADLTNDGIMIHPENQAESLGLRLLTGESKELVVRFGTSEKEGYIIAMIGKVEGAPVEESTSTVAPSAPEPSVAPPTIAGKAPVPFDVNAIEIPAPDDRDTIKNILETLVDRGAPLADE